MKILGVLPYLFIIVFSCANMKNDKNKLMQEAPKIISAEKNTWFGGVKGVEGIKYSVKIQSSSTLHITKLFAEGRYVSIRVQKEKENYYIIGIYAKKNNFPNINEPKSNASSPKDKTLINESWAEFYIDNPQNLQKIYIDKYLENTKTDFYN